ncbi:ADP-ribosylglycohydrolase family protein [Dactylosporangium sp. CA-092794]|uniref:ADP-ribosylglycohydrolase family protein n=1 Tax=Dactylosporangium sp. CA-092794 TaxID=3239929 RepID=UPI003D944FFF
MNLRAAADSLTGLSVGDALGAPFEMKPALPEGAAFAPPPVPWRWTDDTEMACSLLQALHRDGRVDQDRLALAFAQRWSADRGYGRGSVSLLASIRAGVPWRSAAAALFSGRGSAGNGAAMRVAPLGAYFAADPDLAAREAALQAEVTHRHPEGVAGAVAVALAAAYAAGRADTKPAGGPGLLRQVLHHLPPSDVRDGLARANRLAPGTSPAEAAAELGNGSHALAHDTVPFALWVASTRFEDYPAALEACVRAGGDVDSMCAIVGGIVAANVGVAGIPPEWIDAREPLPEWFQSP